MQRKKEPFWTIKSRIFKSLKIRIFPKGLTHAFGPKNAIFFLYLFLVKTRLEIILNAFVEKKQTFFDYNKLSQKSLFPKGLSNALVTKCQFFSLMLIILMKIRLEIMLSDFAEKKETCFDYKNRIFQSPKNSLFQSG